MSNRMTFHRTPIDEFVSEIPKEERRQIMHDFDELERTGVNGDTALRARAAECYRKIQGRENGFDAMFMTLLGYSVHKLASIEAIEAEQVVDDRPDEGC